MCVTHTYSTACRSLDLSFYILLNVLPVGRSAVLSEDQALCGISDKKEMIRQFVFSIEGPEINRATLMCCLFISFHDWIFLLVSGRWIALCVTFFL